MPDRPFPYGLERTARFLSIVVVLVLSSCNPAMNEQTSTVSQTGGEVNLVTLDPGHFHASLIHKYSYDQVNPVVHIYAPDGPELESHLALIEQFNNREEDPTHWVLEVYRGPDYLERMLADTPGNVVVLAGNNARKIGYIRRSIDAGLHVLADKPMVIHPDSFRVLQSVVESADEKGLLVYDIMTERHEITTILQRALTRNPELFGELVTGTPDEPAISKESVHHFYKMVAGKPLVRPAWFFDVDQQGEGIVDVSTHLVDMILWQLFPEEPIDYQDSNDGIQVLSARSWDTRLTPSQFQQVTRLPSYPESLNPHVENDSILAVAANGEFVFKVRDVHAKVSVKWNFENPKGGDTHYSIIRGTRANLVIRQDEAQNYRATLYVEPAEGIDPEEFEKTLQNALIGLSDRYPGLSAEQSEFGREIKIPDAFREGHEEHFTRVAQQFLNYLATGELPEWERKNLLTKYFITTRAYAMSRGYGN